MTAVALEARLRPTSAGTSYHPDSMGFLPLATGYRNGCTQHPFRPPRRFTDASSYPRLDRPASGNIQVTSSTFILRPLQAAGLSLSLRLSACHSDVLPGPLFETDGTTLSRTILSTAKFRGLFTPCQGIFSTFPRGTMRYRSQLVFRVRS